MKWAPDLWRILPLIEYRILKALEESPRSVPELAEVLGFPPEAILLAISGLLRSKKIEPLPKARRERYFRYKVSQ